MTTLALITQNSTLRMYRQAHSKISYRLRVHQFTVQQVGKGGNNVIVIDQVITHHTKFNPKNAQTCPFKGNLLTESAPVHITASGERKKQCDRYRPSYHSSQNSTLRMYRHSHSKVTYILRVHQFTVPQVGKGGNNVIASEQVIIHHTTLNPKNVHVLHYQYQLETWNKTNFTVRNTDTYIYSLEIVIHSFLTRNQ